MEGNANLLSEVKAHYGRVPNYVDGRFVQSKSYRVVPVINPATGAEIAEVPLSASAEVSAAVEAAQGAFDEWRETPPNLRVQPLYRLKALVERDYEEIARIVTQEHGKVIDEARGSVRRLVDNIEFACGIPSLLLGETLEDGAAPGIDEEATVWTRAHRWARSGRDVTTTGFSVSSIVAWSRGRLWLSTGVTAVSRVTRTAVLSVRRCSTTVRRTWTSFGRRSSVP